MPTIHAIFAQSAGSDAANHFWANTTAGRVLGGLLAVVGVFVVIAAIFMAVKNLTSGKMGAMIKTLIGGAIAAAFLFNPQLINVIVELMGTLINTILGNDGVGEIIDNSRNAPAS